MKKATHRKSGTILKTALALLLLAGTIGFLIHTARENGVLDFSGDGTGSDVFQVMSLPQVNFDEVRAHRKRFPDYGNQIEEETARVYTQGNAGNSPWYEHGLTAARLFGGYAALGDFYGEGLFYISKVYAESAIQSGCRDPLILSIVEAFHSKKFFSESLPAANTHLDNIRDLAASAYPAVVKLAAETSGFEDLTYIKKKPITASVPALVRMPALYQQTLTSLRELVKTDAPGPIVYGTLMSLCDAMQDDPAMLIQAGPDIENILKQSKVSPSIQVACRADYLVSLAWAARGSGWASSVQPEGWKGMATALDQADQLVTKAADQYPTEVRLPSIMLQIELGQGKGKYRMDKWFQRAIAIDPNYARAYSGKCYYLQPKWYGSPKEVIEFGWECVQTGKWEEAIPMVFVDNIAIMADEDPETYKNAKLWSAVQSTYEEYLKRYPRSLCYRTKYAKAAALAGKWDIVKRELATLGDHWDQLAVTREGMSKIRAQLAQATGS